LSIERQSRVPHPCSMLRIRPVRNHLSKPVLPPGEFRYAGDDPEPYLGLGKFDLQFGNTAPLRERASGSLGVLWITNRQSTPALFAVMAIRLDVELIALPTVRVDSNLKSSG